MNNAKMWLVVKPSTGVPLLLGGVAVGSLLVHIMVVTMGGWYGDFVNGKELGASMAPAEEAAMAPEQSAALPASFTVMSH